MIGKLRRKLGEEELILTKADKGNAIVLIEESIYYIRIFEVLENCGANISEGFNSPAHMTFLNLLVFFLASPFARVPLVYLFFVSLRTRAIIFSAHKN